MTCQSIFYDNFAVLAGLKREFPFFCPVYPNLYCQFGNIGLKIEFAGTILLIRLSVDPLIHSGVLFSLRFRKKRPDSICYQVFSLKE